MRLSTKSRFAVAAMIDIGLRQNQGSVSLAAIGQRQNISLSYLEQLFSKLRRHGLVDSARGPGGGYMLNRAAHRISVAEIIQAVEAPEAKRVAPSGSQAKGYISTDELWLEMSQKMEAHLQSISLQSLIAKQPAVAVHEAFKPPRQGVFSAPAKPFSITAPNSVFDLGRTLA